METVYKKNLSDIEKKQIFSILVKNFKIQKKNISNFKKIIFQDHTRKFILHKIDNKIVGVLCTNSRKMNFYGIPLKVLGMSYMAIQKDYQKYFISENLRNKLFEISKKNDLIVGFARRAMDNYWYRYGFLGFDSYNKIILEPSDLNIFSDKKFQICKIDIKKFSKMSLILKKEINNSYGLFLRNKNLLSYYKLLMKHKNLNLYITKLNKLILGYFIIDNNNIYEIYSNNIDDITFLFSIKKFFLNKHSEKINIHINSKNQLMNYIFNFNHTSVSRKSWNGGHIAKLVSVKEFLNKSKKLIQSRLRRFKLNNFSIIIYEVKILYINKKLNFFFLKNFIENDRTKMEYMKIFFGIHNSDVYHLNIMFPKNQINISYLDEF